MISKSVLDFVKLSKADHIKFTVEKFKKSLKGQQDVSKQLKQLYETLLRNLNISTSRLIVIPDKYLYQLPFEIFLKDNNYLVEEYMVSYSGSVSLLEYQKTDYNNSDSRTGWSGFAPSFAKRDTLFANKTEVELVSEIVDGKIFTGKDATLDNFKSEIKTASILHLATHAEINQDDPLYTKLIFAKDSVLTASDIYSLSLNTDMTVLSACETGFGKLEEGEGIMSMSRAFQYAGSKSTVMSLWKIPDRASSELMISFYEYLKDGLPKDRALQQAKIDYLKKTENEFLKHPYYWAGFIVSGDTSPIAEQYDLWIWAIFVMIVGFIIIIAIKKI